MKEDKTKNKKKSRKKGSGIYVFMGFALFLATAFYLATNKYFMIEDVLVSGNNKYANDEIIACSQIQKGENLFKIRPDKIKKTLIDKFEYIQDVSLKVTFPTAVIIKIQQAEPYALFKDKDDYLLISENGRVLERTETLVNTKMPIIMGMGKIKSVPLNNKISSDEVSEELSSEESGSDPENLKNKSEPKDENRENNMVMSAQQPEDELASFKPGDYISKEDSETLAMLDCLLSAFEKTDFTGVTKIDITDRLNMKIVYQDRLLILLGSEDNLEYKLNFVKNISEYNEDTNFEGVVDATISKQIRVREMDIDSLINEEENYSENYQVPEIITDKNKAESSSDSSSASSEKEAQNSTNQSSEGEE